MGRKEKRAEEKRILAELDEAVAKEQAERVEEGGEYIPKEGEKMHCRRCKSVMQKGVCPTCGYKVYVPMAEEKRKKIKLVLTIVCLAVFAVLFAISRD